MPADLLRVAFWNVENLFDPARRFDRGPASPVEIEAKLRRPADCIDDFFGPEDGGPHLPGLAEIGEVSLIRRLKLRLVLLLVSAGLSEPDRPRSSLQVARYGPGRGWAPFRGSTALSSGALPGWEGTQFSVRPQPLEERLRDPPVRKRKRPKGKRTLAAIHDFRGGRFVRRGGRRFQRRTDGALLRRLPSALHVSLLQGLVGSRQVGSPVQPCLAFPNRTSILGGP